MGKTGDSPQPSPRAEKARQNDSIADLALEFANETTCHGLKRVATSKGPKNPLRWKNVAWILLLGASVAMAVAGLIEIVTDYSSHPVSTTVDVASRLDMDFPTVTICNLNLAIWHRIPELQQKGLSYYGVGIGQGSRSMADDKDSLEIIGNFLRKLNATEKKKTGHLLSEMMIECYYGQELCTTDNFIHSYNVRYGNCYSFGNHDQQFKSFRARPGPRHALKLVLDVQQDLYLDTTEASGLKVIIHHKGQVPIPEEEGLVVAPGFSNNIGLSRFNVHRATEPYGICVPTDGSHNMRLNMFAPQGYKYSTTACVKTCFQVRVLAGCSCCDPSYPCHDGLLQMHTHLKSEPVNTSSIRYCETYNDLICLSRVFEGTGKQPGCLKSCPPVCEEITFQNSFSLGSWPPRQKTVQIFEKIGGAARFGKLTAEEQSLAVRDNVLKLNVYFEHSDVVTIQAQPAYNWNRLLSDIGGQLGLWLGFSLLTAVEIVELFLDSFIHLATVSSSFCFNVLGFGSTSRMPN